MGAGDVFEVDRFSAGSAAREYQFNRVATVDSLGSVAPTHCTGLTTGSGCYAYNASLKDSGKFTAIVGQLTPNQTLNPGGTFGRAVTGDMKGYGNFATFYATTKPNANWCPRTTSARPTRRPHGRRSSSRPGTVGPQSEVTWGYVYTAHVLSAGVHDAGLGGHMEQRRRRAAGGRQHHRLISHTASRP